MMRVFAAVFWLCLSLPAAAQNIVIATTGTFPPYLFEEGDNFSGFDIDLMNEVCRLNGFVCEYRAYPLMPGLEAVAHGEADIALGGIGISEDREVFGDFTCPYEQGNMSLVPIFALDPSVAPETARIAVLGDSLSHRSLEDAGYIAVPFDDLADAISSVLSGETDAYHGNPNSLPLVDGAEDRLVEIGVIESTGAGPAFLVSNARPRLLVALNDSFAVLHRDGGLQEIADRWFGPGQFVAPADIGVTCSVVLSSR